METAKNKGMKTSEFAGLVAAGLLYVAALFLKYFGVVGTTETIVSGAIYALGLVGFTVGRSLLKGKAIEAEAREKAAGLLNGKKKKA